MLRIFFLISMILLILILNISNSKVEAMANDSANVLLVPLDSRPACSDFVIDAGRIAGIDVTIPPGKLLDYFTIAGEVEDVRKWLLNESPKADAVIISIDQLIKGGLIASREESLSDEEIESLIEYLIELRRIIPHTPIYAFNILPRTQPQSSIDNYQQRRALTAYSRLTGLAHSGLPADDEALFEAISEIIPENLNSYLDRFNQCEKLSRKLIELTQIGVLDKLIVGLDDGEKFSIQNKVLDTLRQLEYDSLTGKVSIIHGADEIALTLLTEYVRRDSPRPLKVYVQYNKSDTPARTLPFMAVSIETVVKEKFNQLRCDIVETPTEADFTLYISVNDTSEGDKNLHEVKSKSVEHIAQFIDQGYNVALVDLGIHFDKEETLLPSLIDKAVPINSLIAYSGWNTASNAIGIALSQAIIATNSDNFVENLKFLNQRFLEDQFYLKDVIDTVNHALRKSGSFDTNYLDYGTEFEFATFVMRTAMSKKIADYKSSRAFRVPFNINGTEYRLKDFDINISYPWPRTFEVRLEVDNLDLSKVR